MATRVPTESLSAMMQSAHRRTLELVEGLDQAQLIGPRLPTVNPLRWEVGHVAWFHEHFILRRIYGRPSLLDNGDALYDSIAVAHDDRWDLPLLPMDRVLAYKARVLTALIERLGSGIADETDSFLYRFTAFHEDMHDEAFAWTRQTLAYPTPSFEPETPRPAICPDAGPLDGDAEIPGGRFLLGSPPDAPFLFDNEKYAHPVMVAPFRMAKAPVSNADYLAFVLDGGYRRRALWDDAGWRWREETQAAHPVYWLPDGGGGFAIRSFDRIRSFASHRPIVHVNWHEANAFCRWAGRRLPTEAEWEFAATAGPEVRDGLVVKRRYPWGGAPPDGSQANLDGYALGPVDVAACPSGDNPWGCRQLIGNIWEWTADTFGPFPGFAPDDYKEYSAPLFGNTKVLRGGAWTTRGRMITGTYRNYFGPERRDVFAGFRTCALG